MVAFFFFFHPSVSAKFFPGGYSTQDHFFSHGEWEILDKLAGKIVALMTSRDTLRVCAIFDWTDLAVHKWFVREAPLTRNLVHGYPVNTR
jgi:hypothetical protein